MKFSTIVEISHKDKSKSFSLYYYHRLISLPLTWLFFKLGVSPNAISFSMILLSLVGAFLITANNTIVFYIGYFICVLAFLFDKIDGDLAMIHG